MKNILYSSFLLLVLSQSVIAGDLTLKYDVAKEKDNVIEKVCNQITGITASTSDYLSRSLQVASSSIELRGGSMSPTPTMSRCCLVLDTPKGIIKVPVAIIYEDSTGSLFGMAYTGNVTESDYSCDF